MDLREHLKNLATGQNQKELDRVDVKSRSINQRFEQVAAEQVNKEIYKEIIKLANINGDEQQHLKNESHNSETGISWDM